MGNNAAHFDGTSSVSATNSIALILDYTTYSLWVNLDELPPSGEAFLISNGGWQQRVKISVLTMEKLCLHNAIPESPIWMQEMDTLLFPDNGLISLLYMMVRMI
jgi:hypothetical protein